MTTYLLCSTPAHGHVTPLLTIARGLVGDGARVVFLTSPRYADRVRATGAEFAALPADADVDLDDAGSVPGRAGLTGPAAIRFDMLHLFLRPGESQFAALRGLIDAHRPDAILTEPLFVGAALLAQTPAAGRPPVIALGILPLGVTSRDTAPFGLGIPPRAGAVGRMRNAALSVVAQRIVFGPVRKEADAVARRAVGVPFSRFFLDWHSGADAIVQFTVPAFEYPRSDLSDRVVFAGPLLPSPGAEHPLPDWWGDLDAGRPVVHVTQGTVANADPSLLLRPALEALAGLDVLAVVSTGRRAVETLGPLPSNARAAEYLPYGALLPRTAVMVTNGGYGGVQQALSHGIPLVVAGQTEDKIEVSARVGWAGVGVNLRTNTPRPAQVRDAVEKVLSEASFRTATRHQAELMTAADPLATLRAVLARVTASAAVG